MNTITIKSNGSKWAGQEPDTLETLIEVLKKEPLDIKSFALYGFVSFSDNDDTVRLFGNFKHYSHVFNIEGPEELLTGVIDAIRDNINRQFKV